MGWNDHVDMVEMECAECGVSDTWEVWNNIALARYSGDLGKILGHDSQRANRCPHCGSTEGAPVDEDGSWVTEC